jgi:hypothetical protein
MSFENSSLGTLTKVGGADFGTRLLSFAQYRVGGEVFRNPRKGKALRRGIPGERTVDHRGDWHQRVYHCQVLLVGLEAQNQTISGYVDIFHDCSGW